MAVYPNFCMRSPGKLEELAHHACSFTDVALDKLGANDADETCIGTSASLAHYDAAAIVVQSAQSIQYHVHSSHEIACDLRCHCASCRR